MNRLSAHEQAERRRSVKRKQKQQRRARVVARMTREQWERKREASEITMKLRGLAQYRDCRSAREYAALLETKRSLL